MVLLHGGINRLGEQINLWSNYSVLAFTAHPNDESRCLSNLIINRQLHMVQRVHVAENCLRVVILKLLEIPVKVVAWHTARLLELKDDWPAISFFWQVFLVFFEVLNWARWLSKDCRRHRRFLNLLRLGDVGRLFNKLRLGDGWNFFFGLFLTCFRR